MTPPRHVIVCGAGVMGAAVAYYLTNVDINSTPEREDPRLWLLRRIQGAKLVEGWNGPGSQKIELLFENRKR